MCLSQTPKWAAQPNKIFPSHWRASSRKTGGPNGPYRRRPVGHAGPINGVDEPSGSHQGRPVRQTSLIKDTDEPDWPYRGDQCARPVLSRETDGSQQGRPVRRTSLIKEDQWVWWASSRNIGGAKGPTKGDWRAGWVSLRETHEPGGPHQRRPMRQMGLIKRDQCAGRASWRETDGQGASCQWRQVYRIGFIKGDRWVGWGLSR